MRARQSVSHPIRIFQWPIKDTLLILSKLHNLENDKIFENIWDKIPEVWAVFDRDIWPQKTMNDHAQP